MPAGRVVRTATIVVTDIVDSTATFLGMSPAAAEDLRRRHDEALGDVVATHGGQVLKNLGDGLLLRFDAAGAGIAASVAMQQAMAELATDVGMDLRMRVGVSVGDVTWEPSDAFGRPVVEAARLCSAAPSSGILVTEAAALCAADELDLDPPQELRLKGFDAPVRAHGVAWAAVTHTSVPLPPGLQAAAVLVGREEEVGALHDHWGRAQAGGAVAVAVAGEPGIGKSSLLAELAHHAHAAGGLVLHGRCDQGSLAPYRPVVEALEPVVEHLSPLELRRAAGRHAPHLARLLPTLHDRMPGLPLPGRTDAASEREQLFDAVASFLGGLAARRPVLLVLDDLQWADQGSSHLVRHVVAEGPAAVAVVVAHRSGEDQPEQGAAAAVAEIGRQGGARLELGGIGLAGVAALVERGIEGRDPAPVAAELLERTGGNPFTVHEVVAALAEGRHELPPRVRDVLTERLARTPPRTQDAVAAVAVAGRDASLALVADMLGVDIDGPAGALAAVEGGVGAGLLVELPGGGRFRCAHDLVRAAAYERQSATRRALRHLAVADHLERRVPDHDPSEVARHLDIAVAADPSLTARAVRAWLRASIDARRQLAYELGRSAAARGLELAASGRAHLDVDPAAEPELHRALADAFYCLGDYAAATEAGARAARLAHIRDLPALRAEALVGLTRIENQGQPDPFLGPALEDALVEPGVPPALRARLLAGAARYLAWSEGRVEEAGALADAAVAEAEPLHDLDAIRDALWARVVAHEGSPDPETRAAIGTRLLALADTHRDDECRVLGHFARAMARLELGNRLAFDDDVTDFEAVARRRGGRFELGNAATFRRLQVALDGRLDDLERDAAEVLGDGSDHQGLVIYSMTIVLIRREQARLEEVAPGLAVSRAINPGYLPTVALYAMVHADLGEVAEPVAALDALTPSAAAPVGHGIARPVMLAWLAEAAARVGSPDHQRELVAALEPYRGMAVATGNVACLGAVDRYLGMVLLALDRVPEAIAALDAAVVFDTRLRAPVHAAWSSAWLAKALERSDARGDLERAAALRASALGTADAHGLTALARFLGGPKRVGDPSPSS